MQLYAVYTHNAQCKRYRFARRSRGARELLGVGTISNQRCFVGAPVRLVSLSRPTKSSQFSATSKERPAEVESVCRLVCEALGDDNFLLYEVSLDLSLYRSVHSVVGSSTNGIACTHIV